jgi:hypothetical protein
VGFAAVAGYNTSVASIFVSYIHLLSMGNIEYRQQKEGNGRPSPIDRQREEDAA